MPPSGSRLLERVDPASEVGLATQTMLTTVVRREVQRAELERRRDFYDRLRDPLLLWPTVVAALQVLGL